MRSTSAPRCSTLTGGRWRRRGKKARNALHQLDATVHNTQWIIGHLHLIFAGVLRRRRDPAPSLAVVHRHNPSRPFPGIGSDREQTRCTSPATGPWPLGVTRRLLLASAQPQSCHSFRRRARKKCLELGHRVWRQRRGRRPQSPRLKGRLHRRQPRLSLRARDSVETSLALRRGRSHTPGFRRRAGGRSRHAAMTMDAPAPPASASLTISRSGRTRTGRPLRSAPSAASRSWIVRGRSFDIPQLFVVVNLVGWMFQV